MTDKPRNEDAWVEIRAAIGELSLAASAAEFKVAESVWAILACGETFVRRLYSTAPSTRHLFWVLRACFPTDSEPAKAAKRLEKSFAKRNNVVHAFGAEQAGGPVLVRVSRKDTGFEVQDHDAASIAKLATELQTRADALMAACLKFRDETESQQ
jgi:hypothetical protein